MSEAFTNGQLPNLTVASSDTLFAEHLRRNPAVINLAQIAEIVFTALLGGFRNFTGPIVGGIVFTYLKTYAVATTEYWQLLLGIVLVTLVLVLPTGIVGALAKAGQLLSRRMR